jgi:hypothetical protein
MSRGPSGALRTGPTGARASPQAADMVVMKANLRHRSAVMSAEARASAPVSLKAAAIRSARSEIPPDRSPTTTRWKALRRSTIPGPSRAVLISVNPPSTRSPGTPRSTSRSAASTPLSRGRITAPLSASSRAAGTMSGSE